jgi:poly(3-hydroxybutyrate) depolymerase
MLRARSTAGFVLCLLAAGCSNALGFDDVSFAEPAAQDAASVVGQDAGGDAKAALLPDAGGPDSAKQGSGGASGSGPVQDSAAPAPDTGGNAPQCSNGVCDNGETCTSCPQDCGACINHACTADPPAGAALPPPLPKYSGGTCPALHGGTNDLISAGQARQLQIAVPSNPPPQPGERLPIIFLWHWTGGTGKSFIDNSQAQSAVDAQRFIAIAPEAGGTSKPLFKWPSTLLDSEARLQEELTFFDDMLACAAESFPQLSNTCVSTAGVSAGGLWVPQLASRRGQYLSSFISMSGGVGGGAAKPWGNPAHKMPSLVLWGGDCDQCSAGGFTIHFKDTSHALQAGVSGQGAFQVECVHSCCHTEPPFEAPAGLTKYAGLWSFVFDHPYWLAPGDSPYKPGIPFDKGLPAWCGPAPGTAPSPGALACPGPAC